MLPAISADEMAAARRSIAITSPLVSSGRSTQASAVMLASVVQRMMAAVQPLCAAYRHAPCQFQVALDPSIIPRAEAYGQERITVSVGMMNILDNEDEIAAVLGHEFGHHLAGHSGHRVARGILDACCLGGELKLLLPEGVRRNEPMAFDQSGRVVAIAERSPCACQTRVQKRPFLHRSIARYM
jgi:Zn-dependent protease with chaperone function